MKRENMLRVESYFEAFLISSLILIFILLIKGFILPLLLASTLVFLTYKSYLKLLKITKSETIAALSMLFFVLISIILPSYLITTSLIIETTNLLNTGEAIIEKIDLSSCSLEACRTIESNLKIINFNLDKALLWIGEYIVTSFGVIFTSVSKILIGLLIFILSYFVLLKDGDKFMRYVRRIIPMKNEYKDALFLRFQDVTMAVFIDSLLIAALQGTLVAIGFYFFGFSSPLFWGVIATFFSLLPFFGAAIIWIPAGIYLLSIGEYYIAGAFILYNGIIVGLSDNVVRPLLLKNKVRVHPFIILLSILGGLELFGFLGIFIGPIIVSLLISVLQLYKLDFR